MEAKYDILSMYFGRDYQVTEGLIIKQPTIKDIIEIGENRFWSYVYTICANPTSMRLELWHAGIDWNNITDYDLFCNMFPSFNNECSKLIFGDLDFSKFRLIMLDNEKILINTVTGLIIDENIYKNMIGYLRCIFDYHPKVEKAANEVTKESIIWEEEENIQISKRKKKNNKNNNWEHSRLFPLISACLAHSGFKYKKNELEYMYIFEFMDIVKRLQIIENTLALMHGMYTGMMDISKINKEKELNWMRDIYQD